MRNIQLIDGVDSATFSISLAPDEAFGAIFPKGQDMELAEKVFTHVRTERAIAILSVPAHSAWVVGQIASLASRTLASRSAWA